MPLDELDLLQNGWDNAREIVVNENELIYHRFAIYMSLQGFLFTALTFGLVGVASGTAVNDGLDGWLVRAVLGIVSFMGFVTSWLVEPAIRAAYRHIYFTDQWWRKFRARYEAKSETTDQKDKSDSKDQKDKSDSTEVAFPVLVGKKARYEWPALRGFPGYIGEDDSYADDLKLSADEMDRLDTEFHENYKLKYGIIKLIAVLKRVWIVIFVLLFLMYAGHAAWLIRSGSTSPKTSTTKITITEDPTSSKATISFQGSNDQIRKLERRLKAIPDSEISQ